MVRPVLNRYGTGVCPVLLSCPEREIIFHPNSEFAFKTAIYGAAGDTIAQPDGAEATPDVSANDVRVAVRR